MAKAYPLQSLVMLQASLVTFSGVKALKAEDELRNTLYGADGTITPKLEFERKALALNNKYNLNHLNAERNAAIAAGTAAAQWQQAQASKEAYPYLRYKTAGDNAVRPEHAALNGIIRPIDDEFWKTHYPPNGYNCRCIAEPVASGKVTSDKLLNERKDQVKVPKAFLNNIGATKEVFKMSGLEGDLTQSQIDKIFLDILGLLDYKLVLAGSGTGYGVIHPQVTKQAVKSKQEGQKYNTEREALQTLANLGEQLVMLPTDNGLKGIKQPDFWDLKNGRLAELKHITKEASLSRALKTHLDKARKQGVTKVFVFLEGDYSSNELHDAYTRYLKSPEGKKSPFSNGGLNILKGNQLIYSS